VLALIITKSNFLNFTADITDIALCEVLKISGSAPRNIGTWMLISSSGETLGTIGGGYLEYDLIAKVKKQDWRENFDFTIATALGPSIGQCCGGNVIIAIKRMDENVFTSLLSRIRKQASCNPQVFIFGAGHVGAALACQLDNLPLNVTVIDNRKHYVLGLKGTFKRKFSLIPEQEIRNAKAGSAFIIVTHDHSLDFLLCYEILRRNDAAYVGMIGSKSKKGVLENWLAKRGINNVDQVKIPIGKTFFQSEDKRPEIISTYIISEMLFFLEKMGLKSLQKKGA